MRISSDNNDPDFRPDIIGLVTVMFNGYEVKNVVTADEERGYIIQDVVDERGNYVIRGDEIVREKRYGGVAVFIAEPELTMTVYEDGKTFETCRAKFNNTITSGTFELPGPDFLNCD